MKAEDYKTGVTLEELKGHYKTHFLTAEQFIDLVKKWHADVSGISTDLEKDLFVLVNKYAKAGLSKPHIVARLEWVLGSVEKS